MGIALGTGGANSGRYSTRENRVKRIFAESHAAERGCPLVIIKSGPLLQRSRSRKNLLPFP
jgi:hypothetical protein